MNSEDKKGIHLLSTSAKASWRLFSCRRSLIRALASTTLSASVSIRPRSCARETMSELFFLLFGMSLLMASRRISHSSITLRKRHASWSLVMLAILFEELKFDLYSLLMPTDRGNVCRQRGPEGTAAIEAKERQLWRGQMFWKMARKPGLWFIAITPTFLMATSGTP